ncbi:MAG: alpha/beta fold hydrolase, partial [Aestuariivirga sp.]
MALLVTALVAIPAFGCDARLYAPIRNLLPDSVDMSVEIADADRFAGCVAQLLARVPERFVVMGTSFGGRLALELTLAAPQRVSGLIVIGSGPGPVADAAAGRRRSSRLRAGEADAV